MKKLMYAALGMFLCACSTDPQKEMEKMIVGEYRRGRSCVDISIARGLPYSKVYEIVKKNNANINIKV